MNAADIVILALVACVLFFIVRSLRRDKKSGGCGCGCANCPSRGACGKQRP